MTVGAESKQKTWYLPKSVLTHCSPFFDAALNGNYVEARSKAVDLPEDDPIAFEMWATWLSSGKCKDSFEYSSYEKAYVRAWILADKLACPAFKDHVMSQFLEWFDDDGDLWLDMIKLVYEVSSPGSKLRRLFVDSFVWDKLNGYLTNDANGSPTNDADEIITLLRELPEFSEDVVRREVEAGIGVIESPFEKKDQYYENPEFKPDA